MFEVEYLWNGWVKKDGVNANLVQYDLPNFKYPIGFVFSPRLNEAKITAKLIEWNTVHRNCCIIYKKYSSLTFQNQKF